MKIARWVAAAGLLAILAVALAMLGERAQRRSGTNLTPPLAFVQTLKKGDSVCQNQELLPADTAALQMTIVTYGQPGPSLAISFSGPHGEPLTRGSLKGGWPQGVVRIPVAYVSKAGTNATFCLRNGGPATIGLSGDSMLIGATNLAVDKTIVPNTRVRIDYLRPGRDSWFALLPTIVHRFSLAKGSFVRSWAWIAVLLSMLIAVSVAVATILKQGA